MKKLIYLSILAATILAACGPQATPTMNPADVQATAFSAASTMVAMTQAAIPTATPLPPTDTPAPTPLPTQTLPVLATVPISAQPTLVPTKSGTDNCVHVLDMGEAGPTRPVMVQNQSGGALNLSLNLYKPNDFGQCGAISYANVAKGSKFMIQIPSGYWYAYAWITLKSGSSTSSGSFYIQLANEDKQNLIIGKETIVLTP